MSAILVVEQDPGYANRVVAALQAAGHEVIGASNRDEAESAASNRSFDLVLANGMMPGAADLLGRFSKASGGPGSVVLLPVTLASHAEAGTYSADGILSKPFSDEDLERVVTGRLGSAGPQAAAPQPAAPAPPQQTASGPTAPQAPTPQVKAPGPPDPRSAAPQPTAPQPTAPQPVAPQPTEPKPDAPGPTASQPADPPVAPQPAAPRPAAPRPAAPRPSAPQTVKPSTVDTDVDDLLNKTLSGLDISSLTRKRPRVKPASQPAAPQLTAPQPAAPQPVAPQPAAPQTPKPTAPQPPPQPQPTQPPAPESQPERPQPQAAQPAAPEPAKPAPQPTVPQPPAQPATESAQQAKPVSLTSTDIFGDVLAEVEAESEKTRTREQVVPTQPAQPSQAAPRPATPPQPAAPQPAAPSQPVAPRPATPEPAASPRAKPQQPAARRSSYDDDLDRKLEETLSGFLPSRLRRKPEEKPPKPAPPQPTAPRPAAPPQAFAAPPTEPAQVPTPTPQAPDLPVDFTEDETVSIVQPTAPRESQPSADETPDAPTETVSEDGSGDVDSFATTLLPTRPAGHPSSQVQPPADFQPPAESRPEPESESTPASPTASERAAAREPAEPEPAASEPAAPLDFGSDSSDSSDEFNISFGEEEPSAPDDGGNIWSAYGSEETAGWGTTSFEAQAPIAPESAPESEAPEPAAPDAPTPEQAATEPPTPEPTAPAASEDLESTGWGSESVWEVPSFEEDSRSSQVTVPEPAAPESAVSEPTVSESGVSESAVPEPTSPAPAAEAPPQVSEAQVSEPQLTEPQLPEPQQQQPLETAQPEAPSFDTGSLGESDFQPVEFDTGPSLQEDPELELESTFTSPEPASPPAAVGGTGFDTLSSELGADDTGSFHTALQGVLQIRGDDDEGTKADDQGIPFGDYRLLERVAVGGMAEVWRARRRGVEGFQKTVAIKRILSHLTGSTDFISMFIDEAKLAAQLNHANIAQIYDLGKVDDDFYIAMEFVEGRDLRTLLREAKQKGRPLPMGQALFIIAAVARGLDYAHRKRDFEDRDLGLVHRDVSPQNVLVSTEGEIKLCDFGIVKAVAKASTTQMGALKGKLQYMSPEQAWGKEVDGRSDIFSLGTVLFEALTGEKLFTGDSEIGVLDAVRDCRIKSARTIDPSIPESVEGILEKTLQASPDDRYQTAGEMERDIQSALETLKPSPGQSDLSKYMHNLVEAPEPSEDDSSFVTTGPAATGAGEDGSAGAWTGTSWGTASFYEQAPEGEAAAEPVSAKIPVSGTVRVGEPVTSKPPEPVSSRPEPMSSSMVAAPQKKGGGKLIWVLIVVTMLAIVAVVAWTQLGGKQAADGDEPAAVAAPAESTAAEGATEAGAEGEEAVDQEELMQQMLQEEMERKKKEMEEQFEAQKRELERRMKEVERDDGG